MELNITLNKAQIKTVIKILKSENQRLKSAIEFSSERVPSAQFIANHEKHIARLEEKVTELTAIITALSETK